MTDLQTLLNRVELLRQDGVAERDLLPMEIEITRVEALQAQATETRNTATMISLVAEGLGVVAQAIEGLAGVINYKRFS
jgi:hypothetical protein